MKLGIDFNQPSTIRGLVWVTVFFIGLIGWWMGKDISGIVLLGTGVAGGLGVVIKDQ